MPFLSKLRSDYVLPQYVLHISTKLYIGIVSPYERLISCIEATPIRTWIPGRYRASGVQTSLETKSLRPTSELRWRSRHFVSSSSARFCNDPLHGCRDPIKLPCTCLYSLTLCKKCCPPEWSSRELSCALVDCRKVNFVKPNLPRPYLGAALAGEQD